MDQHLQHDPELIAAYAEGLLADGEEARRLVEECTHCRREYELQRGVKSLISGLPQARLTDPERLELHAIIERLPGGRVVTLEDRRRTQRWMRVASVAAAGLVLVGLGAVFVGMMGAGSRNSFTTSEALLTEGPTEAFDTAAATTTIAASAAETYRLFTGGDADAVRAEIDAMLDESSQPAYGAGPSEDAAQLEEALCTAEVSSREVLQTAQSRLDGRPIVIFVVATEDGREALVYDEATCVLVELPPD
jgi:hypothetical protein